MKDFSPWECIGTDTVCAKVNCRSKIKPAGNTVRLESRCALRPRYSPAQIKIKRVQACIEAHGHHFQHLL